MSSRETMKILNTLFPGLSNEPIKLFSKYTAEVSLKKLNEEIADSFSLNNLTQQKLIIGRVIDNCVSLRFNGRVKNSFRKTLTAKIKKHESGSILYGQFSASIVARYLFFVFGAIVAAFFISVASIILFSVIFYGLWPPVDLLVRTLIVLMILIGFNWIGRTWSFSAKSETKLVKQFLIVLLDGEEA